HELFFVFDIALGVDQSLLEENPAAVSAGSECARLVAGSLDVVRDELLVGGGVDRRGVPAGGNDAQGFVAHVPQNGLVAHRLRADNGNSQSVFGPLPQEAQAVRSGRTEEYPVDILFDLRKVGRVVGGVDRSPDLLHDLSAVVL